MTKRNFGLIGKSLKHSFSKKYFSEKFELEKIPEAFYNLYELERIDKVNDIFSIPGLVGFNITIPYKEEIKPYLDEFDESAKKVGAVNVVKIHANGKKTGYNSDYYGFKNSLEKWADLRTIKQALILGTGGASKAIIAALKDLEVQHIVVSRSQTDNGLTYKDLRKTPSLLKSHQLIVNCTPLGTFPDVDAKPDIDYRLLSNKHYLYDLVYNPEVTAFMKEGLDQGAFVKNGLEMLILQAEKSWEIWNREDNG